LEYHIIQFRVYKLYSAILQRVVW